LLSWRSRRLQVWALSTRTLLTPSARAAVRKSHLSSFRLSGASGQRRERERKRKRERDAEREEKRERERETEAERRRERERVRVVRVKSER